MPVNGYAVTLAEISNVIRAKKTGAGQLLIFLLRCQLALNVAEVPGNL